MPSYNPLSDHHAIEAWDGSPLVTLSTLATAPVNVASSAAQGIASQMNTANNTTNAAGTSENLAIDVAVIVVLSLAVVFFFKHSGIRFVAAAGAGISR